ncbi:hypothetical protein Sme01_68050 [Sphaerisporangium melleum]|uniref:non-specific serine/threonine protein kinase n=1 Tax=Sphaerisporangium melleum TaxID=321316 RepID=A0A917VRW9_9ACTN|nr:serine/threonine-protein kinase [Sphaerisporangium melleum]GGL08282.1 hypothetical protein GCM10007964_58140 [Sphaerisporangium melleum]GII74329.1 hypothetical protein Sme01_68050 [Sphaerisporangium melleum]
MADSGTPGLIVAGRYRLVEPLGQGGMGVVWRAVDELLRREVAVKELLGAAELTRPQRELFTTRIFREARAAGRLSHPGVATVYDVFEEGGCPWIVMRLVPSRTLGAIVREDGPLPPRRVAEIGLQILAALEAAHGAGVLHRDVKPDNVLIGADGNAVLTDFGIATLEEDAPVTRTGALVGTPAFVAPERALGGRAERASDLWSLGVTLYFAVQGESPFERGHMLATLGAVVYQEPEPCRAAGALAQVIEGLLVKDPAGRMAAAEVGRLLADVAVGAERSGPAAWFWTQGREPAVGGVVSPAGDADTRAVRDVAVADGRVVREKGAGVRGAETTWSWSLPLAPRRLFVAAGATLLMGGLAVGGLAVSWPGSDRVAEGPARVLVTVLQTQGGGEPEDGPVTADPVERRVTEAVGASGSGRGSAGEAKLKAGDGSRSSGNSRSSGKGKGAEGGASGKGKGPGAKGNGKGNGQGKGIDNGKGQGNAAKGKGAARKAAHPAGPAGGGALEHPGKGPRG